MHLNVWSLLGRWRPGGPVAGLTGGAGVVARCRWLLKSGKNRHHSTANN